MFLGGRGSGGFMHKKIKPKVSQGLPSALSLQSLTSPLIVTYKLTSVALL